MKAIKVNEIQNFEQGGKDLYKTLNIGNKYEVFIGNPNDRDRIELQEEIFYVYKLEIYKEIISKQDLLDALNNIEYGRGTIFEYSSDDMTWTDDDNNILSNDWVSNHYLIFKQLRRK